MTGTLKPSRLLLPSSPPSQLSYNLLQHELHHRIEGYCGRWGDGYGCGDGRASRTAWWRQGHHRRRQHRQHLVHSPLYWGTDQNSICVIKGCDSYTDTPHGTGMGGEPTSVPMLSRPTRSRPPRLQNALREVPLQRMEIPEEIASLILFLFSQDASYITGQARCCERGISYA